MTMTFNPIFLCKYGVLLCYLMTWMGNCIDANFKQISMINDTVKVTIQDSQIAIQVNAINEVQYETTIGKEMPMMGRPTIRKSPLKIIMLWPNGLQLLIGVVSARPPVISLQIKWTSHETNLVLRETINMSSGNWYGGGVGQVPQSWPIQSLPISESPFVPGYKFGNFAELYFLSSSGFSYVINQRLPLFLSIDNNRVLHLRSEFKFPYHNAYLKPLQFEYTMSFSSPSNMLTLRLFDAITNFGFIPYLNLNAVNAAIATIRKPIWTVPKNPNPIAFTNQRQVQSFAKRLYGYQFPPGFIEILDGWEECKGNNIFNSILFKSPDQMISYAGKLSFEIALRVRPFVDCACQSLFDEGVRDRHFVTVNGYSTAANISTPFSRCSAVIDVTNDGSSRWWAERLNRVTSLGVSRLDFIVGTDPILPNNSFFQSPSDYHPGYFFKKLATLAQSLAEENGVIHEIDSSFGGTQSQGRYLLHTIRHCDLESLIHSVLNLGIVGYPLVTAECDFNQKNPNFELFVRWTQICAFLPVLKFSLPNSFYTTNETLQIIRESLDLREQVADVLEMAATEALVDGTPIIRPLWWLDPNDITAQSVADEFLVSSIYLVAPITTLGLMSRAIYIPAGTWSDMRSEGVHVGPTWLRNYPIALNSIAYFKLIE